MPRFQYHIVNLGMFKAADRMVKAFAHLGAHGWELVGMYDKASNWFSDMEKGFAVFKREVPDGEEPDGPWAEWQFADEVGETKDPNWGAW